MSSQLVRPIEILLVEDNPADVRLTQEALKDGKVANRMSVVTNGVDAIAFLRKKDQYANAPHPDLIVLDLNLPKKNGHEVLSEIKTDPQLKTIPVVILTISAAEEDIFKAYFNHVNCYITKSIDINQFIKVVKSVENFWFTIVKLPPHNNKWAK